MKLAVYVAEFTKVEQSNKEGQEPTIRNKGSVRLFVDEDTFSGSLAGLAFRRATQDQLEATTVTIRRETK